MSGSVRIADRSYPFRLPDGWFGLEYSDRLASGETQRLRYFSEDLALARDDTGQARVTGADGAEWPLREALGMVWVWRHAKRAEPGWELPSAPELEDPGWTEPRRYRWRIRTRSQEMCENAVDRAHFRYVHGTQDVPESEVTFEGPLLHSIQRAHLNTPRGEVEGKIDAATYGFGCSFIRYSGICRMLQLASTTPVDEYTLDARYEFRLDREQGDVGSGVGQAIIGDILKQMSEDIPIWEYKVYRERPVLCDGDGPLGPFRRWTRQFYSDSGDEHGG